MALQAVVTSATHLSATAGQRCATQARTELPAIERRGLANALQQQPWVAAAHLVHALPRLACAKRVLTAWQDVV